MVKDDGSVQTILPVLLAAHRKITARPSVAEDSGSASRNAKHILNVLLNSINGKTEVGGQTAALSLLGVPSEMFSHDFAFIYPWPTLRFVKSLLSTTASTVLGDFVDTPTSLQASDTNVHATNDVIDVSLGNESLLETITVNLDANVQDSSVPITTFAGDADVDIHLGGEDYDTSYTDENADSGVREIVAVASSEEADVCTVAQHENYYYRVTANDRRLETLT